MVHQRFGNEQIKHIKIEVKSSGYKTHASLDAFQKKFSSRIGIERTFAAPKRSEFFLASKL